MNKESKARAAEYAKNYPLVTETGKLLGPVAIANVGEYDGRDIINLCIRTPKSGANNASISFPKSWGKTDKFQPGMLVNFIIDPTTGYVQKIWEAKAKAVTSKPAVSAARVNDQVAQASDELAAENAVEAALQEVDEETGELTVVEEKEGPF